MHTNHIADTAHSYYHNGTFLVVTDEPWAVPELKYLGVMNHQNAGEQIGSSFKILAVRGPPIGRMQAHKKDVESISVANASLLTATSLELGAPMVSVGAVPVLGVSANAPS
jgi:hypothetical protein